MKSPRFFYSSKSNKYLVVGKDACDYCLKPLVGSCVLRRQFFKDRNPIAELFCLRCTRARDAHGRSVLPSVQSELTSALVVLPFATEAGLGSDFIPVNLFKAPELKEGELDENALKEGTAVWHTKWAGRNQCEQVDVQARQSEIGMRVHELGTPVSDDFFVKTVMAVPIVPKQIAHTAVKQIEHQNNEGETSEAERSE